MDTIDTTPGRAGECGNIRVPRARGCDNDDTFHRGYYRHHVENFFCALKRHRRVATRYEKLATSFAAFVSLSAILYWIGE